jgi:prolyl 4-hydroxylase
LQKSYPDQASLVHLGDGVRRRLAADPAVYRVPTDAAELFAVGAFLTLEECAHLIAEIDRVAKPSDIYHSVEQALFRTSYSGDLNAHDSFVKMIERRLGDLTGIDLTWGETVQGQRYTPGQEFRGHYDWFDVEADYWKHEEASGGQRSWTAMVYLNDVEEGGSTEFPRLNLKIEPQAGALLLWNNALPDGRPNPDVLHAALPVVRGVKYVITKWFRARRWT